MEDPKTISQYDFELIERFINNDLNQQEIEQVEQRIKIDTQFKTNIETVRAIINGIETQSLKEQLDTFHDTIEPGEAKVKPISSESGFPWKAMLIAAVFVIAAGSYFWLGGSNNDKLYDEYFTLDPGLPTTMSTADNYEFSKAMVSYKQGNYQTAIDSWKNLKMQNATSDTLNYFIAAALLANKQESEAIPFLQGVLEQGDSAFKNETYFYLGLAFLKADNIEEAKEALRNSDIAEAQDLLNKLD